MLAVWVVRLVAARYGAGGTYSSDEVCGQNLVAEWTRGFLGPSVIGSDTYFLKFPLYLVVDNLPLSPLAQLFTESVLLLGATSGLVLWSLQRCMTGADGARRPDRGVRLGMYAAAAALAGMPKSVLVLVSYGDSRNIEIGIGLYLVSQVYLYTAGAAVMVTRKSKAFHVALAGCLFADDPLFTFAVGVPVAAVVLLGVMLRGSTTPRLAVARHWGAVASVAVAGLLAHVVVRGLELGLNTGLVAVPVATVPTSDVVANLGTFVRSGVSIFGLGTGELTSGVAGACLGLLYVALYAAGTAGLVRAWRRSRRCLLYPMLLSIVLTSIALYLLTQVESPGSERYMVLCPIVLAIGVGLYARSLYEPGRSSRVVPLVPLGAGCLACVLAIGSAAASLAAHAGEPDQSQLAVVRTVELLHLHKGYSEYWSSEVERFLSGGALDVVNIGCAGGTVFDYNWWQDSAVTRVHAGRTFYVLDEADNSSGTCDAAQLDQRFGRPALVVPVRPLSYGEAVFVYDYDIGTRVAP